MKKGSQSGDKKKHNNRDDEDDADDDDDDDDDTGGNNKNVRDMRQHSQYAITTLEPEVKTQNPTTPQA